MKKFILILFITLFNPQMVRADSICEREAYNRCLQLYETSAQQRQTAKNLNMSKTEYCRRLAEQYCTPIDE